MVKVFISQSTIDNWLGSDKVELLGDVLTFRANAATLRLTPASHFQKVSGGGDDRHALLGKVKDQEAIVALGGEAYMTSVILGETAYDVAPGFVGRPSGALFDGGRAIVAALRAAGT